MSTATRLAVVLHRTCSVTAPHVQRHCNGRAVTLQGGLQ